MADTHSALDDLHDRDELAQRAHLLLDIIDKAQQLRDAATHIADQAATALRDVQEQMLAATAS